MNITIGSDPEFMLQKRDTKEIVSAIPVVKQGKDNKISLGDGYYFYYDNVMVEANIPPRTNEQEFVSGIDILFNKIESFFKGGYSAECIPSAHFSPRDCQHEDAMAAGCDPEFCAYDIAECVPPRFNSNFRSAGGHIHIGRDDFKSPSNQWIIDDYSKIELIKAMDYYVGIPSLVLDNTPASVARRKLYGKAGRHRPTFYGVEYRVLSNYWLKNRESREFIFNRTMAAIKHSQKGDKLPIPDAEIRDIIDNNRIDLAQKHFEVK